MTLPPPAACRGAHRAAAQGDRYAPASTRFITGQIETDCGAATSEVGPLSPTEG
jgi:hypothetical protein